MTLTTDLQNLIRSSVGTSEYSMSVLSTLFKPFMRYHDHNTMDERTGQPKIVMPLPTPLGGEDIKVDNKVSP